MNNFKLFWRKYGYIVLGAIWILFFIILVCFPTPKLKPTPKFSALSDTFAIRGATLMKVRLESEIKPFQKGDTLFLLKLK